MKTITIRWNPKLNAFVGDLLKDRELLRQIFTASKLQHLSTVSLSIDVIDTVLDAVSSFGYELITVGYPSK